MNFLKSISCAILLGILSFSAEAQEQLNVLFIGNSITYFNDMPGLFQSIALSKGQQLNYVMHTPGGTGFVNHVDDPLLYNIIRSNDFDIVVMQPGTGESAGVSNPTALTAQRGLTILDSIKKYSTCVKGYIYEIPYGVTAQNDYANYFAVQSMIEDSVSRIASLMHLPMIPAGECQYAYYQLHQDLLLNGAYGDVHPSYNGSYLVASCMYATIFEDSVSGTSFSPGILPQNLILFDQIVDSVVFDHLDLWGINSYDLVSSFQWLQNGNGIQFQNGSQNYDHVVWNFGDGQTSTEINPVHSYAQNGTYPVTLTVYYGSCELQSSQSISIQTNELSALQLEDGISVYPNPASAHVQIRTTENITGIVLTDLNGKQQSAFHADFTATGVSLDVSQLEEGIYFIHLEDSKRGVHSYKILKVNGF